MRDKQYREMLVVENEDVNNGGMRQRDARLGCKAELGRTIIEAGGNTNRNRGGHQRRIILGKY